MSTSVAITGLGAVSALGRGADAILRAMIAGRSGITEMTRFDLSALHPVRHAGWLRAQHEDGETASLDAWAVEAALEAWRDAGLDRARPDPARIAVVSGTTLGEEGRLARSADAVAEALGARGPRWTITTACASSANALGLGRDLLLAGDADVVVAGGAEKLVMEIMSGFAALGVLGPHPCAPFGAEIGTTLGEGAGFVVLERAGAREGARSRAYFLGYGLSGDAWHETSPDPRGEGTARALRGCLADAGIPPERVDYVNAHATGTAANDDAEWRGIQRALGTHASKIPVSASKGYLGHAQGAAGVLGTIATIYCLERHLLPPSARAVARRPHGPPDVVGETGRARAGEASVAMSISAAFGGANAVLAVGRHALEAPTRPRRVVSLEGAAALGTAAGCARDEHAIAAACGDVELRGTDPSARYTIACVARALADADVRLRGAARDRTGLFGACGGPPRASVEEYRLSLQRGARRASAPAFARTVAHAPLGAASIAHGLRGPTTMVVADAVGGLLAIAYAARWLGSRDDADRIVAGGLDERALDTLDPEGAAFVVLGTSGRGPEIRGIATAGARQDAVERALAEARLEPAEVDLWLEPRATSAASFDAAHVIVDALAALRETARAVVASAAGAQGAVALVLVDRAHEQPASEENG